MTNVYFVGWFSDLPHGRTAEAAIRASIGKLPGGEIDRIVRYLNHGTVITETTGAVLYDELAPERPEIGAYRTATDGEFVWPSDYPYYVEKYAVAVPDGLREKAMHGLPRPLSDAEIDTVVDAILA